MRGGTARHSRQRNSTAALTTTAGGPADLRHHVVPPSSTRKYDPPSTKSTVDRWTWRNFCGSVRVSSLHARERSEFMVARSIDRSIDPPNPSSSPRVLRPASVPVHGAGTPDVGHPIVGHRGFSSRTFFTDAMKSVPNTGSDATVGPSFSLITSTGKRADRSHRVAIERSTDTKLTSINLLSMKSRDVYILRKEAKSKVAALTK
ncbi:hypothetical protein B296_00025213 [Ensete ventricosum]|uniref:Uncharacterized protein n=1 Tax=Ensete ventricosum TaxID=4639 RepID=A0A427AH51_ENSVE|nr:hypothetical protein B296_00025213 [Ensete ventricosum]